MRVTGIALGVRCGEHSVHQHECSNNLSTKCGADTVSRVNEISTTAIVFEERPLKALHKPYTTDCSQALCYHVGECTW
jgi:hypothetical protein